VVELHLAGARRFSERVTDPSDTAADGASSDPDQTDGGVESANRRIILTIPGGPSIAVTRERLMAASGTLLAIALLAVVAVRCTSDTAAPPQPPATEPPGTTAPTTPPPPPPPVPIWPLTGLLADPVAKSTPAVAVKVDNSPSARPHAGLNQADLVYELQVESITRFMEVFHSNVPDRVGPVRSARGSDMDLLFQLGRPLFMWSGGNGGVTGAVRLTGEAQGLTDAGANSGAGGHYYRDRGRSAPHNLYGNARAVKDEMGMGPEGWPGEIFLHSLPGTVPPGATPAGGVRVDFGGGVVVEYHWDPERKGWNRFQSGRPFVDEAGTQVSPENVVVLFLEYTPDEIDARSPKAQSVGAGEGIALMSGTSVPVRWKRDTNRDTWNLTNAATGEPVRLGAGRAWVALAPVGQGSATIL
jgi:hypothetical protein